MILNHQHYFGGTPCEECEKILEPVKLVSTVQIEKKEEPDDSGL